MNLAAHESASAMQVERVRHVFGEPVIPVTVGWGGNMVVFAGPACARSAATGGGSGRTPVASQKTLDLDFRILSGLVQKHLQHAQ